MKSLAVMFFATILLIGVYSNHVSLESEPYITPDPAQFTPYPLFNGLYLTLGIGLIALWLWPMKKTKTQPNPSKSRICESCKNWFGDSDSHSVWINQPRGNWICTVCHKPFTK